MSLESGALSSPLFSPSTVRAPGRELGIGPVNPNPLQVRIGAEREAGRGGFGLKGGFGGGFGQGDTTQTHSGFGDLGQVAKFVPQFTPQESEAIRNNFFKQRQQINQQGTFQNNEGQENFGSFFQF